MRILRDGLILITLIAIFQNCGDGFSPLNYKDNSSTSVTPDPVPAPVPPLPVAACVLANPTVTLSTANQSGDAGTTLIYNFTIKNNDSAQCADSTYAISSMVASNDISVAFLSKSAFISAGQSTTMRANVTSLASATAGDKSFTIVAMNSADSKYIASADGKYTVNAAIIAPTFANIYNKILLQYCIGCHGTTLATYAEVMQVVTPKDPSNSLLYINTSTGIMPKGGPMLSKANIQLISDWITAGALNN